MGEDNTGWIKKGKEVFCYFDNDEAGYAATNALELSELVRHRLGFV